MLIDECGYRYGLHIGLSAVFTPFNTPTFCRYNQSHIQGVKPVQLSTIDNQIERIAALLTKYNYTDDEKAIKLSYLKGYVSALLDASVISAKEYDAYTEIVNAL